MPRVVRVGDVFEAGCTITATESGAVMVSLAEAESECQTVLQTICPLKEQCLMCAGTHQARLRQVLSKLRAVTLTQCGTALRAPYLDCQL